MRKYNIYDENTNINASDSIHIENQDYGYWPGTNLKTFCVENTDKQELKRSKELVEIKKLINDTLSNLYENVFYSNINRLISTLDIDTFSKKIIVYNNSSISEFSTIFGKIFYEYLDNEVRKPHYFDEFSTNSDEMNLPKGKISIKNVFINGMNENYSWIKSNSENPDFKGKWVAIEHGNLLEFSRSYKKLLEKINNKNSQDILITKII